MVERYFRTMIITVLFLTLAHTAWGQSRFFDLFTRHKKPEEIARMNGKELIEEYIREDHRHLLECKEYLRLIKKRASEDPEAFLTAVAVYYNQYDPTKDRPGHKYEDLVNVTELVNVLDANNFHVKGYAGGRAVIQSLSGLIDRMKRFYTTNKFSDYSYHQDCSLECSMLKDLSSDHWFTDLLKDSMAHHDKITMNDGAARDFLDFLTQKYPQFPGWSEHYFEVDSKGRAIAPRLFRNFKPFHDAYQEYLKTKNKPETEKP